ncbi:MAG: 4Fe-4S dicluster domain-containing protein [Candidatus Omnitrophica bacterium]|nr:4Fe-4S dicluster domain-containing protein [Candidatus Omnitrophota bacterium]MDD5771231.1 4Fe-4S dicluster domain-containing protein [Candidatus Omnitrophota bacterium]
MARIIINKDKCKGCFLCMSFCPKGLLKKSAKLNKRGLNFVEFSDSGDCVGCMQCAIICPDCCIEVLK